MRDKLKKNKLLRIIVHDVRKIIRFFRILLFKKTYIIIKQPSSIFEIVAHIQDETWNTMYTPEIFEISKERILIAKYPEIVFYNIERGVINVGSDIVLTDKGAWWEKYNEEDFTTLALPADANLVSFDADNVTILPAVRKEYIRGRVLPITGVYSYAWSHFLFQFLCKLICAGEAGLLQDKITLLTNEYNDENIEYILSNFLSNFPKVERRVAERGVDYICEHLICTRSMSTSYNEAKVFWDYRLVVPNLVVNKLHEYVSFPIIDKIKNNPQRHKKIFLSRHTNRKLTNTQEVESYFKELGFYFVEGFELTLEEKVDLFYHAEIIVGLHSSAWQNIIFCNKAKCLMLVNNRFAPEMLFYTMAKDNVSRWINVCGLDVNDNRRSDFYIPLEKIKRAYEQLINGQKES